MRHERDLFYYQANTLLLLNKSLFEATLSRTGCSLPLYTLLNTLPAEDFYYQPSSTIPLFLYFVSHRVSPTWIEECLLTELKEGDVVVLDNASFHKSSQTQELIESKGARLLSLPRYSPDLRVFTK